MTLSDRPEARAVPEKETPEQAARAISAALDFLQVEASAVGMFDVSELIGRARTKADQVAETHFPYSRG